MTVHIRWTLLTIIFLVVALLLRARCERSPVTTASATASERHTGQQVALPELRASAGEDSVDDPVSHADHGDFMSKVVITPSTGLADPSTRTAAAARLDETIANYGATMTYPLSSRPADGSNAYLTHWNRAISVAQPFAMDPGEREIAVSARIDRVFVAPGAAVTVQVSAMYVADNAPAALDDIEARLQWYDPHTRDWVTAHPVPITPVGDGWTGNITPSDVPVLKAAVHDARIAVVVHRGAFSKQLELDFAYAVDPPVTITRIAHDELRGGNLEIALDVQLATASPVRLIATLFASDGVTAIAVSDDRYFPQHAGGQTIPVRFFGKILHDREINGPYRLGGVHGYVVQKDQAPDHLWFDRADEPVMMTARYSASSFSAAPYQSPETEAMLARYRALRDELTAP